MSLVALLLLSGTALGEVKGVDFYQDFRSGRMEEGAVRLVGPQPEKFIRREPAGLRITLPAEKGPGAPVGVAPRPHVRGDFEITASFSIAHAQEPKTGYGSGIVLQVIKETETLELASVTRVWRHHEGNFFVANRLSNAGEKPLHQRELFPSQTKSGKLRLVRQGSLLQYFIAEGDEGTFQEVYRNDDFGTEDLRTVRLVADTGKSKNLLDVYLHDLRIRCATEGRTPGWNQWLLASGAAALLFALGAATVWLVRRARQVPAKAEPPF